MSKYNHHFKSHFAGCLKLADAYDPHRNRQVELRMLPGEFDVVGVTDGTDAWIAPVSGDPFSVSVKRILEDLRNGKMPAQSRQRTRVVIEAPQDAPPTQGKARRSVLFVEPDPTPTEATKARRRVNVHA